MYRCVHFCSTCFTAVEAVTHLRNEEATLEKNEVLCPGLSKPNGGLKSGLLVNVRDMLAVKTAAQVFHFGSVSLASSMPQFDDSGKWQLDKFRPEEAF